MRREDVAPVTAGAHAPVTVPVTLPLPLPGGAVLRLAAADDVQRLVDAYRRNRKHLAPWEPARSESFFTNDDQARLLDDLLARHALGEAVPLVVVHDDEIVGRFTVSGIVRGPFLNGQLGYWIAHDHTGQGLATTAVDRISELCGPRGLGLHRLQAATLLHNAASQTVLRRAGFEQIGMAPRYLNIAGVWQDHLLFQRILE
ncbi:GNAT family N-acetyltransferase [Herbiconiux daphne]|uniref:GNAT family N-acetyltransferase n=1 Tax=Herbiconiux daphne TaxID=2970914 RepID=A0ABT2H1K6_9MICO|nr:GNAT family N-acetyltransferase [Herbiconiux daphne]MCS5733816.1 GNAT family N-acetyltransferase [Herbiconiux daphne]